MSIITTRDVKGASVQTGDKVRILDVSRAPDMDDDDVDMIEFMIGSICDIDRVDAEGFAWVTMWWSRTEGVATSTVALAPHQMERVEGMLASNQTA